MKLNINDCMHPGDFAGITAIKKIPKFQTLLDFIASNSFEKCYKLFYYSSSVKLTRNNAPSIYKIMDEAVEIFSIDEDDIPEIFIIRSYEYFAAILGVKEPMMIISTAVIENLSDDELRLYLIPYFASIAAGHNVMNFIKLLVNQYGGLLPFPKEVLQLPIYQWSKQKEYTYDRIRLILTDDLEQTAKFIGIGEAPKEIMQRTSLESRLEASRKVMDYTSGKAASRNVQVLGEEAAWNASRLIEIFNWCESGAYSEFKNKIREEGM